MFLVNVYEAERNKRQVPSLANPSALPPSVNQAEEKAEFDPDLLRWNKIVSFHPNEADVYEGRGLAYWLKGMYQPAIEDFNKAIALNPNSADVAKVYA
jgi:tetratricopeptide (TPR) repeat protein